ncbi:MAG: glycosyltransferase family 39 protein [Elusimicrobiota bacterium]
MSRKRKNLTKSNANNADLSPQQPPLFQPDLRHLAPVLAVALFIRLFYLHQSQSDILSSHLVIDAKFYDDWASQIAGGDWLGKTVFYQDPLYAYFLACLYKVWGHSLPYVRVCQAVLDTGTVALIFILAKRLFNPLVGLVSAALVAGLSPMVYYVGLLDKTTISIFLITAALAITAKAISEKRLALYAAGGAAFGVSALSRGNMLVVAAAALIWITLDEGFREVVSGLKRGACFGLGVMAIVGVVAFRNYIVGHDAVLITANPGLNFFIGNNPYTIGQYIEPPFLRGTPEYEGEDAHVAAEKQSGKTFTRSSEVSRYWFAQGLDFILHDKKKWLTLSAKKIFLALNGFEIAETYSYYYFQEKYWSLSLAAITYGLIAPLGLVGAIMLLFRRNINILHVFASCYLLSLVAFFVTSRYRIPLTIAWAPFAGWLLVEFWNKRRNASFIVGIMPVLLAALFFSRWQPAWIEERVVRPTLSTAHTVAGYIYMGLNDEENGIKELELSKRANPGADVIYVYLGELYQKRGDMNMALSNYEQALRLNPQQDMAWGAVGLIYFNRKDYRRAAIAFQNALKIHPNEPIYQSNFNAAVKNIQGAR